MSDGARSRLAAARAAGVVPTGIIISSLDPGLTEIIGRAGFEFVIIEGEHGPMGPVEWLGHIRAAEATGLIPMVRVPENRPVLLQKAVELGAQAVVVPHIDTAEEAAAAVAAVRLPPHGNRGRCSATRAAGFSRAGWDEHIQETTEDFLVIPILESERAMNNIEEILEVDGIDLVQFGPGDLSSDLGVPMTSPRIAELYRVALHAANERGKHVIGVDVIRAPDAPAPGAIILSAELHHFTQLMEKLRADVREQFPAPQTTH